MRRITPRQEALLAAVSSAFAGVNVHWDEERGVASSLRGPLVSGAISDADAVFGVPCQASRSVESPADSRGSS